MSWMTTLTRFAAGAALLSITIPAGRAAAAPITLGEAVERASRRPLVDLAGASAEAARHERSQAGLVAYNPELSVGIGPRFTGDERTWDLQVGLAQTIQLGGKRAARRAVASARADVANAEQTAAELIARLEAWRTFQLALVARERVVTAREAEQVSTAVEEATRERQKVGFGTQLELNLTAAEVGRARHERLDAERKYAESLARLASAVGAAANETVEPAGALTLPAALPGQLEAQLLRAVQERPEARIAQATAKVARAERRAAEADAIPDLGLGVAYEYAREGGVASHTTIGTVAIGVPLFNRNQGRRRAAGVLAQRAELEARWTTTEIAREVRVAYAGYERAREAVLGFDTQVNDALHANLELARASYTSGKIDYFQFNVVRRELLASRAAYLDAFEEAAEAWAVAQQAAGGEVMP